MAVSECRGAPHNRALKRDPLEFGNRTWGTRPKSQKAATPTAYQMAVETQHLLVMLWMIMAVDGNGGGVRT